MDCVALKYLATGSRLWSTRFDLNGGDDELLEMAVDPHGNVYLAGGSTVGTGNFSALAVKLDTQGQVLWSRVHDGNPGGDDRNAKVAVDDAGFVYLAGEFFSNGWDVVLRKLDAAGNVNQAVQFDSGQQDFPRGLALTRHEDVFLAALTQDATARGRFAVVKVPQPETQSAESLEGK